MKLRDSVLMYIGRMWKLLDPEWELATFWMPPQREITRKEFYTPDKNIKRQLGDHYIHRNCGVIHIWHGWDSGWVTVGIDDGRVREWS